MKNERLKHYEVRLTTIGPVYVGNGKEYGKKEYILENGYIYVPDQARFWDFLEERGLVEDYEDYLVNQKMDLGVWLASKKIYQKNYDEFTLTKYECGKLDKRHQILPFIKDPYGMPYIPGSSLKGMLRTALLAYDIKQNPSKFRFLKNEIDTEIEKSRPKNRRLLNSQASKLERVSLESKIDVSNDKAFLKKMSGIIVGDSQPMENNCLGLYKKIDVDDTGKRNELPIYRESIKPGTEIVFSLTIDSSRSEYDIDIQRIKESLKLFSEYYYQSYLSKFAGTLKPADDNIWIGGGVGFVDKTVIYSLLQDDVPKEKRFANKAVEATKEILSNQFPGKHNRDFDVSPHVLKLANDNHQFGQCKIVFTEV